MRKRTLQIRLPMGVQKCGNCPYTPDPFCPDGTTQCPLFAAGFNAGRAVLFGEWKAASCGIGEKDNCLYRCEACLDADMSAQGLVRTARKAAKVKK